jgi:HK97 family phage prohead protease
MQGGVAGVIAVRSIHGTARLPGARPVVKISGFPIVFSETSVDLGGFVEQIRPEAVDTTLRGKFDVVALVGHDSNKPLGRVSSRSLVLIKEPRGLEIDLFVDPDVTFAADVIRLITRGTAVGGSFGFVAYNDAWSIRDGMPFREIVDMAIREVSIGVTWPAYGGTRLKIGTPAQRTGISLEMAERRMRMARAR